uniref:DUF1479 domain-containing protein n=1 Tax=Arcella intermedia TaxID=1963864 RepID=A0A6B2L4R6_9EUKA
MEELAAAKGRCWTGKETPSQVWERFSPQLGNEIKIIKELGSKAVPIVQFSDIVGHSVSPQQISEVKKRGVCIIRNVVPKEVANEWHSQAQQYVQQNKYFEQKTDVVDTFFDASKADISSFIFHLYWSKAQIEARQHPNMELARGWMNRFWSFKTESGEYAFDPDKNISYADRLRIRKPSPHAIPLKPHVDGGSVERWLDPNFLECYKDVFNGNWDKFDPWDGAKRVLVNEYESPNTSTVFRTFQGWLAISAQGAGRATLQVVPLLQHSITALLMRPLLPGDYGDDPLCGAKFGLQHVLTKEHEQILEGLVTIPDVEPGDAVFWHPDVIHAVEAHHNGELNSSVFYIGAVPLCEKNLSYAVKQRSTFENGQSPPDFPKFHKEATWSFGRATKEHLSELGNHQMGYTFWPESAFPDASSKSLQEKCKKLL